MNNSPIINSTKLIIQHWMWLESQVTTSRSSQHKGKKKKV